MSSLFPDAMRAAIYCNVSGCPPETPEQEAARLKHEAAQAKFCSSFFEAWDADFGCELLKGHAGNHSASGANWELQWKD